MLKKYISPALFSLLLGFGLLSLTACQKDLADTNIDPNKTTIGNPDFVLTGAIRQSVDTYLGAEGTGIGGTIGGTLFSQHWAESQYPDLDRYRSSPTTYADAWKQLYLSVSDLGKVIEAGKKQNNPNYVAVATTMRAWIFTTLTDLYGSVPYSQAFNINTPTSKYDTQKEVYLGLLKELEEANKTYDIDGPAIKGDPIYNNDLEKWKKFSNSLRLRIALRMADAEPELARQAIATLGADPVFIENNTEIASLKYGSAPSHNPIARWYETRPGDYRVSKTLIDLLYSLNDPRIAVYANVRANILKDTAGTVPLKLAYIGMPNGLTNDQASSVGLNNTSLPGTYFTTANTPGVLMSASEVYFLRAEAVARGFLTGDAEALYKTAIDRSLTFYGADAVAVAAYLAQPAVQYNSTKYKESIGTQKWITLYGQGLEAFTEWRRLDYPQLTPASASLLNAGEMPLRFLYPDTEQSLNQKSYAAAVAQQGPDVLTTRLWFDIQ